MAIDSLVMRIGATAGATSASAGVASAADGARFARALSASLSPSVAGAPDKPVQEIQRAGTRSSGSTGLGHQILNSLDNLYRNSQSLRPAGVTQPSALGPAPDVRTAALTPGPAAALLAAKPSNARLPAASGSIEGVDFDSMLRSLEQVYTHAIQVSVVTKTTGSFTSSMNKLMSSA